MPFLTLTDPRAKIKGSRDPLGLQSIWTRFGRQVVTNLTTVTTSVRGFTTLLLGLYFAEQAIAQRKANEAEFSDLFLKFEQLAAYSRVAIDQIEEGILGIQRAKKNLTSGRGKVNISRHQDYQILSNQKTYGLWGLYMVAARNSGLLEIGRPRLTPIAIDFIEAEYLPRLDRGGQSVFPFLERDRTFEPHRTDSKLATGLAKILEPQLTASEKAFYSQHLLFGGKKETLQHRLWQQIKTANWDDDFSMPELKVVIEQVKSGDDADLTYRLENIRQVELVIAPLAILFGYVLSQDGQAVPDVVKDLKQIWGRLEYIHLSAFNQALLTIEDISDETRSRLISLSETLQTGDYAQTLELLLAQNKAVMAERGSNAWVVEKKNQLDVRFRDESGFLLDKDLLPNLWLNTYFINSLKMIGWQVS
jgi:hypothetical protein